MTSIVHDELRGHPFMQGIGESHLEKIAATASVLDVASNKQLFREDEEASATYLLLGGLVSLEIYVPTRGGVQVGTVHGGEVLGWSWLVSPYRWHFDARALETSRLIRLDGLILQDICDADHELGYTLVKRFMPVFQRRIESLRVQLLDLYGSAPARPRR
jgi:CRP-like cAMP-binding protein